MTNPHHSDWPPNGQGLVPKGWEQSQGDVIAFRYNRRCPCCNGIQSNAGTGIVDTLDDLAVGVRLKVIERYMPQASIMRGGSPDPVAEATGCRRLAYSMPTGHAWVCLWMPWDTRGCLGIPVDALGYPRCKVGCVSINDKDISINDNKQNTSSERKGAYVS